MNANRSSKPLFTAVLSTVLIAFFLLGIIAIALDQHKSVAPKCAICQLKICINGVENFFTFKPFTVTERLYTAEEDIWDTFRISLPSGVRAPPLSISF
jgi:hypothetical protein